MTPLLTRISAPAALPVSLEELKAHLRVEHAEEDAALTRLLGAATSALDGPTGQLGRCQHQRVQCAIRCGDNSGDALNPGDYSGQGIHQHR